MAKAGTKAKIEKVERALRVMTDLEVDLAYQAAFEMAEEELVTACLLELNRRHLKADVGPLDRRVPAR